MRWRIVALLLVPWQVLSAQTAADLAYRLARLTAVAGFEQAAADTVRSLVPGANRDRAGNVIVVVGEGSPTRLVACPLDETGYVVGNVSPDGFLTLRRVGRPPSPLFDQWHEGHRLAVWTRQGPRPAVMAVPSTHLLRGRRAVAAEAFHVDDARVDVGAATAREVDDLGIALLDPVALEKQPHHYGANRLAAPESGRRGACAALVYAVRSRGSVRGTVVAVFAVESRLRHRGLLTAGNWHGPLGETVLLNYPVPERLLDETYGTVGHWALSTRYSDSAVETIDLAEVERLADRLRQWIGGGR